MGAKRGVAGKGTKRVPERKTKDKENATETGGLYRNGKQERGEKPMS